MLGRDSSVFWYYWGFLILPWVAVKGLGNKILALSAKQMPPDWETRYGCRPMLLETLAAWGKTPQTACLRARLQKRSGVFAVTYRAATARERSLDIIFPQT